MKLSGPEAVDACASSDQLVKFVGQVPDLP
jgi:hypothetical protein